jgi:hypothetical protein
MASRLYTAALFVLYQLSLLAGILLFPLAVLTRRAGLELPVHRVVSRLGSAYEQAA